MKKLLLTAVAVMMSGFALFAQTADTEPAETSGSASRVDLAAIERIAKDKKAYRALVKRFEQADSTLTRNDRIVIYLGTAYQKGYTGGYSEGTDRHRLYSEEKYAELYKNCKKRLAKHPTDVRATKYMYTAIWHLKGRECNEFRLYQNRYWTLLLSIIHTGKGTKESPFMVIAVDDEYDTMQACQVEGFKGQRLEHYDGKACDVMSFEKCVIPDMTQFYFDVSLPLTAFSKTFE